jgi:hypothetical protein
MEGYTFAINEMLKSGDSNFVPMYDHVFTHVAFANACRLLKNNFKKFKKKQNFSYRFFLYGIANDVEKKSNCVDIDSNRNVEGIPHL